MLLPNNTISNALYLLSSLISSSHSLHKNPPQSSEGDCYSEHCHRYCSTSELFFTGGILIISTLSLSPISFIEYYYVLIILHTWI